MDIGFETIGNATVICYDRGPTLVTDPWISDSAYFGSWSLSHEIPEQQAEAIRSTKFAWFSHGHPDHLNSESLPLFHKATILLPDHVGGRISKGLELQGYSVRVLPDRQWFAISDRIKILCITDYNQDAILLININGRLIVNTNDARERGWGSFVRQLTRKYPVSFLLAISGFGDADMNNFYDQEGRFTCPLVSNLQLSVGKAIARKTESLGAKYFIPFSSHHRYQRKDSEWANQFTAKLSDYEDGFDSKISRCLPAFIRYDCTTDDYSEINPCPMPNHIYEPEHFGDSWSDMLDFRDVSHIQKYFLTMEHLAKFLDFIIVRVGKKDNIIQFRKRNFKRGVTFEAPRRSLMTSIRYKVFDDMLIGNFMKTTLHGKWPKTNLHPDFTPYVAKYADNGEARSLDELKFYFEQYKRRAPFDYLRHQFEKRCIDIFRSFLPMNSKMADIGKRAYWTLKKHV